MTPIPTNPDTRLRRKEAADALRAAGFPVSDKTLATKATRGGGPPYALFGRVPLTCGPIAWIGRSRGCPRRVGIRPNETCITPPETQPPAPDLGNRRRVYRIGRHMKIQAFALVFQPGRHGDMPKLDIPAITRTMFGPPFNPIRATIRVTLTRGELFAAIPQFERDAHDAGAVGNNHAATRLDWRVAAFGGGLTVIHATDIAVRLGLKRFPRSWRPYRRTASPGPVAFAGRRLPKNAEVAA